jgi:hypothetical protein
MLIVFYFLMTKYLPLLTLQLTPNSQRDRQAITMATHIFTSKQIHYVFYPSQHTDKLYHIMLYRVHLSRSVIRAHWMHINLPCYHDHDEPFPWKEWMIEWLLFIAKNSSKSIILLNKSKYLLPRTSEHYTVTIKGCNVREMLIVFYFLMTKYLPCA